ncbi:MULTISPECIES: M24 family metallopeptidase [Bacillaceae]|uniref:Aminopeptidase P family protein n=1 Tax=Neobacillus mesonae TaxID=1193713 RepID=A0A3Q9QTH2_9BACI|nr:MULTISPECIES: Xaa-Pro peptidase family protein [Bacillaceae]AZU59968.1 aminopeptidase P family protein [Neobacillus mesonae]MED0665594.1 Xaa-Pro peptidase family protein [Bacillus badius]MED4206999.1 Xaa-Pro peptidase family protein [Neobacillus mesonae]
MIIKNRIFQAQIKLQELNIQAVVVTSPSNFYYFSGTWLDSHERLQAIIIPQNGKPVIIVHEMSKEEILITEPFEIEFWKDGDNAIELLAKKLYPFAAVSIDDSWPSGKLLELMEYKKNVSFTTGAGIIQSLRLYKDEEEIDLLRESGKIADEVIEQIIEYICPGMTEKEVGDEIKRLFALKGVDKLSFNPIVGTGKNGAIPHHQTDKTIIRSGDMVVIDMGGVKNHYCSDITRTIVVETEPTEEMKKVYEVVKKAQDEAVKAIRPGIALKEIDKIARDIISNAGYGINFTHRTGHGIGIDVHEEPYVTFNNSQILEPGMVISVEPGIYLSDKFGVRIEDIVLVTSEGHESINNFSRDLIVTKSSKIEMDKGY